MISNTMNGSELDLSTANLSCAQELERNPLQLPAEASIPQPTSFGHSVQMLNLPHPRHLGRQTHQAKPSSSCPPNGLSISHSPPTESKLASVGPLKKDTQQKTLTETVNFNATKSSRSGESMTLILEEAAISGRRKASKSKCYASEKDKGLRARYNAAVKCREAQARYDASVKRKEARARYLASEKGRQTRARYLASGKGKLSTARSVAKYSISEKGKNTRAKYAISEKGKLAQAIRSARSYGYRLAIRQGFSEELAREKGELAADKKRAELSSASASSQS